MNPASWVVAFLLFFCQFSGLSLLAQNSARTTNSLNKLTLPPKTNAFKTDFSDVIERTKGARTDFSDVIARTQKHMTSPPPTFGPSAVYPQQPGRRVDVDKTAPETPEQCFARIAKWSVGFPNESKTMIPDAFLVIPQNSPLGLTEMEPNESERNHVIMGEIITLESGMKFKEATFITLRAAQTYKLKVDYYQQLRMAKEVQTLTSKADVELAFKPVSGKFYVLEWEYVDAVKRRVQITTAKQTQPEYFYRPDKPGHGYSSRAAMEAAIKAEQNK